MLSLLAVPSCIYSFWHVSSLHDFLSCSLCSGTPLIQTVLDHRIECPHVGGLGNLVFTLKTQMSDEGFALERFHFTKINEKALKCKPSALIFGRGHAKELLHVPDDLEHVTESIRKTTKAAKALYG